MSVPTTLQALIDVPEVAARVEAEGFCFLEALLDRETVARLEAEFERAFRERPTGVSLGPHPPGRMAVIDTRRWDPAAFPTISAVFSAPPLADIARAVLPAGSGFNEKIALTHETADVPSADVHFDSQRSLKFLVYLVDTDERNAAFGYAPGSHVPNSAYRREFLARGGHLLDLQNVAADAELNRSGLERLEGPAGSMIVFDTDGWHSAGRLANDGLERKVIRSRSRFAGQLPLRPPRFTPMWFRRTFGILPPRPPFELPGRERTAGTSRRHPAPMHSSRIRNRS